MKQTIRRVTTSEARKIGEALAEACAELVALLRDVPGLEEQVDALPVGGHHPRRGPGFADVVASASLVQPERSDSFRQALTRVHRLRWRLAMAAVWKAPGYAEQQPSRAAKAVTLDVLVGCLRASERFELERGIGFMDFADWWIRPILTRNTAEAADAG